MKRNVLGRTGIEVTELCFGILPIGPLQANIERSQAIQVMRAGMEAGINFFDTAELYGTAGYLGEAMSGFHGEIVVTSKSMAQTYEGMEQSVLKTLKDLQRPYVDIMLLHAARFGPELFEVFDGALQCLLDYKKKGAIRAVGLSCHNVQGIARAAEHPDIDVVFPLNNVTGLGVLGGSRDEMTQAIAKCHQAGKGLYLMKALGGGTLAERYQEAMAFARSMPGVAAQAVGMINQKELEFNLRFFNDEPIAPEEFAALRFTKRLSILPNICKGCGSCLAHCPNGALSLVEREDGRKLAQADKNLCVTCGYCSPYCPEFAIRMV
jgi:aryl-alcohol dehydrogenase-like predicted oxidoreductase/NAD-dependent dihydropyrimidine dehydrogenase PreA subunit